MADNISVTAGTGTTIATDDISNVHYQKVKLIDSTAESTTPVGTSSNPLYVQHASAQAVSVSGSVTVDASGSTVPVSNAGLTELAAAINTNRLDVNIASDSVGIGGGTQYTEASTDVSITGTAIMWEDTSDTLRPVSAAKPLPVDIQDSTIAVTQSGTWDEVGINDSGNSITVDAPVGTPVFVRLSDGSSAISTLPVSLASVPSHAVTNAGTFATQESGSLLTAAQLIDDVIIADDGDASSAKVAVMGGMYHSSPPKVSTSTDAVRLKLTQDGRPLSLTESTDSFNINNNYSSAQTNTSQQAAPGASKRLVVTKIVYSRDTAGNMRLVEDPAGTPATKFGPHYFPANGGMVAVDVYIPLTANKALGITTVGGGNETFTCYGITENV